MKETMQMEPPRASAPRVGGGAAIVRDGRMLLVRRLREPEAGCWGLPGGKVEWMEAVEQSVRREIHEELGIVLHDLALLEVVNQIDHARGEHWVAVVYRASDFEGVPAVAEPDKHDALGWFALTALPTPLTVATVAAVAALRARGGPGAAPCEGAT
jgi:ADP-ribose pyrophosphatase YjhB (NUDIX family)